MNFLSGISIAQPLWLLAIPVATAILVYVYRRRGTGNRVLVATTLLLKLLPKEANSRSSFFPPLRFFLELLVCILLTLILAGLETEIPAKNIAILIDNSFHTHSRAQGRRNFDIILDQARANITTLTPDTQVSLFASAPGPTLLATGVSPAQALEQLNSLQPAPATGSLQVAAEYISQQNEYESLYIYSDAIPAKDYQPGRSLYYFPIDPTGPRNNIAIRSITWADKQEDQNPALRVSIASFSEVDEEIRLGVRCLQSGRLEDRPTASKVVILDAGVTLDTEIPDISSTTAACLVEVNGTDQAGTDAIQEDNSMWIVARSSSESILLVSSFSLEELNLTAIDSYSFTHQRPEVFLSATGDPQPRRAVILHRTITPTLLNENALYITPERAPPFLPGRPETNARVTVWDRGHPLVRYANLSAMRLPEVQSFQPTLELVPVVYASEGALLLAGEQQFQRSVVAGFEMLPFRGKESPTLSILFLNSLKWIMETTAGANAAHPFETLQTGEGIRYSYLYPSSAGGDTETTERPDNTGLLKATIRDSTRYLAVQYFDSQESDLRTPQIFTRPEFTPTEAEQTSGNTSWWILIVTLVLLLLDMLISLLAPARRQV